MNSLSYQYPSISVVIIAYNEEATIGACVEAACRQDYPNIIEILIVDGNSTDRTQEIVGEWQKKDERVHIIIEDPNRVYKGTSEARRRGIEAAESEYTLLLNGDISVPSNYAFCLMEFIQKNNLTGAAGLRWCRDAGFIEDFVNIRYWLSYQANPDEIERPSYLSSDAAVYQRADLLAADSFDPVLAGAGDDADIAYRLTSHGKRLRYCRELLVFHKDKHYRNLFTYIRQRLWYGQGMAQLAGKYPFRYVAEQNKVHNFIIRPVGLIILWVILTLISGCISWQLVLAVQFWALYGMLRLIRGGYRTYRLISQAATPTRIRPICCWLWPIFDWLSYVLFTLSYMRNVESPDVLYRKWTKGPMFSSVVKATNINFSSNKNTCLSEKRCQS